MEPIGTIVVAPSTDRKAEPGRFGTALRNAAAGVANGLAATVGLAAPYVPGGYVLAGALRQSSAALAPAPAAAAAAGAGAGDGDVLAATRALQQESQAFNLQYIALQNDMQRESREFTALTNVMKVKHDSAKAAINNVH